eukprot:TRINITY_DN7865_c0_g1_i1.p1 TRINITY_DN7865_c0_g1~~TRINITY_DN7865_c0_g1_i1.p1  ORF type:complete len:148 (-),score=10.69 TRINITY_DN7865_c0_g1_i1:630-1073(-)
MASFRRRKVLLGKVGSNFSSSATNSRSPRCRTSSDAKIETKESGNEGQVSDDRKSCSREDGFLESNKLLAKLHTQNIPPIFVFRDGVEAGLHDRNRSLFYRYFCKFCNQGGSGVDKPFHDMASRHSSQQVMPSLMYKDKICALESVL